MSDDAPNVCIIIPVYNEIETLPYLIQELVSLIDNPLQILVVDDSDAVIAGRTETLCRRKLATIETYPQDNFTYLYRGERLGRGSAVRFGLEQALTIEPRVHYFIECDADGSHRAIDVQSLIGTCAYADVVIGSRYMPNSEIVGWPLIRRLMSRFLNRLIPYIFGIKVSDITNGLRCYSREAAQHLAQSQAINSGFIYLTEQLLELTSSGYSFIEKPTRFVNRSLGSSTVNASLLLKSAGGLIQLSLRYQRRSGDLRYRN